MLDALFVAATIFFFAVAILYIYGCNWFIKEAKTANREESFEKLGERGGQIPR